jgi:hypothetical protein
MSGDKSRVFPVFGTFTGDELMRLDDTDFDQLDALDNDPEGAALWWQLRRQEWAEQDRAGEG